MDVLQSEAMIRVQQCLLDGRRQALLQALGCIEAGEFGDGVDNGNEIDAARRRKIPSITRCKGCAQG